MLPITSILELLPKENIFINCKETQILVHIRRAIEIVYIQGVP